MKFKIAQRGEVAECGYGEANINTLDELRAFALGGDGRIEISFVERHGMTDEDLGPVIFTRGLS